MRHNQSIELSLFFFAAFVALNAGSALAHEHHPDDSLAPASAPADMSIFNLDQTWSDDGGRKVKLSSLSGKPLVVAMVYSSCQAACPIIVSDMKRIEAALPKEVRGRVRFALFSFDPVRDSQKRLGEYRRERKVESWLLLRSGEEQVRDLAAVLGFRYKLLPNGDYQHSNLITVIDSVGVVRYQLNGLGQGVEEATKKIVELAR